VYEVLGTYQLYICYVFLQLCMMG